MHTECEKEHEHEREHEHEHASITLPTVTIRSQPDDPASQEQVKETAEGNVVFSTQVSAATQEANEMDNRPRIPDGYLYLLVSPTSSLVKCGSTKNIYVTNERYLVHNSVIDIMYFPVFLGNGEHLFNYELSFHKQCQAYRHNPIVPPDSPPLAAKLQASNITKSVKWERTKRQREGRQELYERRHGDVDLIEFYQEVLCDIVCGNAPSLHESTKKRFVNCCSACVHCGEENGIAN